MVNQGVTSGQAVICPQSEIVRFQIAAIITGRLSGSNSRNGNGPCNAVTSEGEFQGQLHQAWIVDG